MFFDDAQKLSPPRPISLADGSLAAGAAYHSLNAFTPAREGEAPSEPGLPIGNGEPPAEPRRNPARTEPRPPEHAGPVTTAKNEPRPAPGRMFVVGRVLDPQGKPVPNAMTMVYAATKQPGSGGGLVEKMKPSAIGQARSDDSGRFQIDAPRTSSSRHHRMGAVAIAPGYGAGWVELDPDADRPIADISLWPEQVIQGRLFDLIGRPVQGVAVRVQSMGRVIPGNRNSIVARGPFWWNPGNGLPAWPKPAISDSDGRFTVRGVGRDLRVVLMIDDPRFARQMVPIDTDGDAGLKPVTLRAGAGQDHQGPHHGCRYRQADPPCPAQGLVLRVAGEQHRQRIRGRRRGAVSPIPCRRRPTATRSP